MSGDSTSRRSILLSLAALGALLVAAQAPGCAHQAPRDPAIVDGARRLTILHTNDIHGHYLPERAEWIDGKPEIGGFVRLEEEVTSLRGKRAKDSVLLFDGGDELTGTPLSDVVVDGVKGGAMHAFFERLGYDAWVLGNHEFDKGLDNLRGYTAGAASPVLSSNVRSPDGGPLLPNQEYSKVFRTNGVRIGVIGVTTGRLAGLMSRADFARLTLTPEPEAVRAEVARLDPLTDLIVVLSHIGLEQDEQLAASVPGIDLIVGAHSHTRLTKAVHVGDTWIVQAGSYNRSLGVVDLTVEGDAVLDFRYELRDLLPETAPRPPDPTLLALTQHYKTTLDAIYGEVVSTAHTTLTRSYNHESSLGDWITDALRDATGADVAFYNGGGLRADLVAGPVTRGALFECFPFNNDVVTFRLTGEALIGVVIRNLAADSDESRGYLSASGLRWVWRVRGGAPEVVEARVGETLVDPARTYLVASSSYIAEHWDKHFGVEPTEVTGTGQTDLDAAISYAKKGPIQAPGDIRSTKVIDTP